LRSTTHAATRHAAWHTDCSWHRCDGVRLAGWLMCWQHCGMVCCVAVSVTISSVCSWCNVGARARQCVALAAAVRKPQADAAHGTMTGQHVMIIRRVQNACALTVSNTCCTHACRPALLPLCWPGHHLMRSS
jgi:hypothetical protein